MIKSPDVKKNIEPTDVLFRVKRGLSGYISYLAACEMNQAFSEYMLYEPILRILTARGFSVTCEYPCPENAKKTGQRGNRDERGDKRRIDFHVTSKNLNLDFAIEVKWVKRKQVDVKKDFDKLRLYHRHVKDSRSFLCVFGRQKYIKNIVLRNGNFSEKGKAVYADFRKTKFGCRIFELKDD